MALFKFSYIVAQSYNLANQEGCELRILQFLFLEKEYGNMVLDILLSHSKTHYCHRNSIWPIELVLSPLSLSRLISAIPFHMVKPKQMLPKKQTPFPQSHQMSLLSYMEKEMTEWLS